MRQTPIFDLDLTKAKWKKKNGYDFLKLKSDRLGEVPALEGKKKIKLKRRIIYYSIPSFLSNPRVVAYRLLSFKGNNGMVYQSWYQEDKVCLDLLFGRDNWTSCSGVDETFQNRELPI